jgi:hypothetical protein
MTYELSGLRNRDSPLAPIMDPTWGEMNQKRWLREWPLPALDPPGVVSLLGFHALSTGHIAIPHQSLGTVYQSALREHR